MLTRAVARVAVLALVATTLLLAGAAASSADEQVYCPPSGGPCRVIVGTPGGPGDPEDPAEGGGGGGGNSCPLSPFRVCYHPGFGWYNPQDHCHYRELKPQPPTGDPAWEGHSPSDGAVYWVTCTSDGKGATALFLTDPPPGFGGGLPSPAELAAQAVNMLPIKGPDIGIAPNPNGVGLVGMPIWMWTAVTPATWGPASATASVPGLSVTATARAEKIVWSMGDGNAVTCGNTGTPYKPSFGRAESPTCGYDQGYQLPSSTRPGGRYTVAGATTWQVTWVGGGQSGELTVTRTSSTTIAIEELQVVTR